MGKGVYMSVLNLDSVSHITTISDVNCMYSNGDEGSELNIFNNTIAPFGAIPSLSQGTSYIESKGSGICAFEDSQFQLNFDGSSFQSFRIQTPNPNIQILEQTGTMWTDITPSGNFLVWGGQPGLGVIIPPSEPINTAPFSSAPGATWMGYLASQNSSFLGSPLNMICLPGSHDTGMSEANHCTTFANSRNTQTQTLNVAGQLNMGIRYFDIRPALWSNDNDSNFYTGHFSGALGGQGCLGENLSNILDAVSTFINTNTSEFVVLKFSHYEDNDDNSFPLSVQQDLLTLIQTKLSGQMLTAMPGEKVGLFVVNEILKSGTRVICVFDGLDSSLYNPTVGILQFGSLSDSAPVPLLGSNLDILDSYTGTENTVFMMVDQMNKFNIFKQANLKNGELFLLSYTLTLSNLDSTPFSTSRSILDLANKANPWLWDYATALVQPIAPGQLWTPKNPFVVPNIVYIDNVKDNSALLAAVYFNSLLMSQLTLQEFAIRSAEFGNLSLRAAGIGEQMNCQWGVGPWERFKMVEGPIPYFYLTSVEFGGYVTAYAEGATAFNPSGVGKLVLEANQSPNAQFKLGIDENGDGGFTIQSNLHENMFIRLDGTGVSQPNGTGVGEANCQFTSGTFEKLYFTIS